jgi:iron complex outermembrane receptor protein
MYHLRHFFLLLCIFSTTVFAQTGTIKGTVKTSDNKPVEYANVVIKGTTKGAATNMLGEYIIQNAPVGEQTIVTSHIGTEAVEKTVTVKDNETAIVDFILAESASVLGEVVVIGQKRRASSATKTNTPLEDLPISIQILDKELMQQQLIIDTRDAVKNVSGITVTGTYNGGYTVFDSRGFWMTNWSNFRRNGMMIWNMGHHHNDNIEQVEILKGPASVLYGDISPGAVMNFVTKKPLNYDYKRFELRLGQYGLIRPAIDLSGPLDDKGTFLYRLNASYEKSNSFRDEVNNETMMFSPALTWKIHPKLIWDAEGVLKTDERVGDPGIISPDGTFEGINKLPVSTFLGEPSGTYGFQERNLFSTFTFYLDDNWKIRNQTYYSATNRAANNIYFSTTPDSLGNLTRFQYSFHQYWRGWGNGFDIIGDFETGAFKHQVLIGFDYMKNGGKWSQPIWRKLDSTINVYNPEYGLSDIKADPINWSNFENFYERTGIYAQDQISAFDGKLQLLLGARYNITRHGNDYDKKEDEPANYFIPVDKVISPRFGLVYKPVKEVSLYGSYSQSYEMNGVDGIDPSKVIQPTDASQTEFGVKTSLLEDRLGITVSAFQIDKRDIYGWVHAPTQPTFAYISWRSDWRWATYVADHHQSKGFELDVHGKLFDALTINATYAYVKATVIEDPAYESGKELQGNARNSGSLWLNYDFKNTLKGFELGYGIYYKDKFYMSTHNKPEELVKSYYSMDVSVAYRYEKFTARLNTTNLTNNIGYLGGETGRLEPYWVRRVILSVAVTF